MAEVQLVFSADEAYFLLAKGLVLSIHRAGGLLPGYELAFIDLGCTREHLEWFREQGVRVVAFDMELIGSLAHLAPGRLRALVVRPFLPLIFPEAVSFIWLDCDIWIQSPDLLRLFGTLALTNPLKLFICPEWHYSYIGFNTRFVKHQVNHAEGIFGTLYDRQTAGEMSTRPTLNAGVFAMAASNPLWELWKRELSALYSRNYGPGDADMRHMAEQTALNLLAARHDCAIPVDPLFNYICMWSLPIRDSAGIVRVAFPPNVPIAAIHLVQWKFRRQVYFDHGLLYDAGNYLTEQEKIALLN